MKILFGIIAIHLLVIIRAGKSQGDHPPIFSVAALTLLMTLYVLYMLFIMEEPEP